jgi:hypothetical protein
MLRLMKTLGVIAATILLLGLPGSVEGQAAGKWVITVSGPEGPAELTAELTQDGAAVAGTVTAVEIGSAPVADGVLEGSTLTFVILVDFDGQPFEIEGEAEIEGDEITGSLYIAETGSMPFTGRRAES